MEKYRAGFAGAGHMGRILAAAAAGNGEEIAVSCRSREHGESAAKELGCSCVQNQELLLNSAYLFLGMRPQDLDSFVQENREAVRASGSIFVSMLAGTPLNRLEEKLGPGKKIIRIMPNTPCAVGSGLIFCTAGRDVSDEERKGLESLLRSCGELAWIDEADMDAVSVLGGCGPAYVYAYADALARAGEAMGLNREASVRYAAQMLLGSAEMILKNGKTPEELKKEVCSPGGTTIEGVRILEERGLEQLVGEALQASYRKTRGM